uniref:Thyroglobulin type-1 domain-containing protein n=1 Tax=Sparus aurata TaxID=8175 RepID=A0A671WHU3_SPAAU
AVRKQSQLRTDALLFVVVQQSRKLDPFLITENMWPRGCVLDCQRGRHRAVCGSNGRLYKSVCAFQRAQCINTQLRLAPRAHCSDPSQSKCQQARTQALDSSGHNSGGHMSPAAAVFVPECHLDGHFLPVQCHNQTGYCWCSTPDGKPVSGTSVLHLIPNCTGQNYFINSISKLLVIYPSCPFALCWCCTFTFPLSSLHKPLKFSFFCCAELTAPPLWVTILMNSDPKGNRSPQTCERERASLLRSAWQEERFIPECTADGRYSPAQCHAATGYCWCVRVDSGRPLPGTSQWICCLSGCPGARKKQFLQSLVRALQLEADSPSSNTPPSITPSSSTPHVASPVAADPSGPEEVLRWHFSRLDVDSSGVLSEREARPLRQFLRRRLKPRRCAKKFAQYCDRDGDRGLALEELRVCLGAAAGMTPPPAGARSEPAQAKENSFVILKSAKMEMFLDVLRNRAEEETVSL